MKSVEITYRYQSTGVLSERPADAKAALRRLDQGSRAFAMLLDDLEEGTGTARRTIEVDPRDLGFGGESEAPEQRPFAAVLGCSDARVPVELIFNEGPNDLFVVRVAGNVLGNDVLASLKYAVDNLGGSLKLVVILGHGGCGAVSAAVDLFLHPAGYLDIATKHILRGLLDRLLVVVHAAAKAMIAHYGPEISQRPGYRDALIDTAVVVNAALAAYTVQQEIGPDNRHGLRTAYGVYDLAAHRIWAPRCGSSEHDGLAESPADLDAFVALGSAVVRSERITSLLQFESK